MNEPTFVRVHSHRQRNKLLGIIAQQKSFYEWSARLSKGTMNSVHFYQVTEAELERLVRSKVKFTRYKPQSPRNLRSSY